MRTVTAGEGAAPLRVSVTGRLGLEVAGALVDERSLPGRQARLAFVFLVVERFRLIERDELADVVWPRALPAAWQPALRSVVARVRAFLAATGLPGAETLH